MRRLSIIIASFLILGAATAFAQEQEQTAKEPVKGLGDGSVSYKYEKDGKTVNKTNDFNARFCVSTNFGDWALFGTANLWAQFAVARHFTIEADAKYNPWTFHKGESNQFQYRQQTYALGMRYWLWYTYSGWWFGAKAQYQEYNYGGLGRKAPLTEEGDAVGLAIDAGYSLQVTSWMNIDFGLGIWGGLTKYVQYSCPQCGKIVESGNKLFIRPNEAIIAVHFIF